MSNSLLKARKRVVNFRVTEGEYESMRNACIAMGCRSISEYAREAALRRVVDQPSDPERLRDALEPSAALLSRVLVLLSRLTDAKRKS
jgi:hypothetical protein